MVAESAWLTSHQVHESKKEASGVMMAKQHAKQGPKTSSLQLALPEVCCNWVERVHL